MQGFIVAAIDLEQVVVFVIRFLSAVWLPIHSIAPPSMLEQLAAFSCLNIPVHSRLPVSLGVLRLILVVKFDPHPAS